MIAIDAELEAHYRDIQARDWDWAPGAGEPDLQQAYARVRASLAKLREANSRIMLIGSRAVVTRSEELLSAHEDQSSHVLVLAAISDADQSPTAKQIEKRAGESLADLYDARSKFMFVARTEMADGFEIPLEILLEADKAAKK
jgi:hypothetical protein